MTERLLESLTPSRRDEVLTAVAAVESARFPVQAKDFRALLDPQLRHVVEQVLAAGGRSLVETLGGFLSGYDDGVREQLIRLGIGQLPADQRAVLAMVLLFCVAIPRAEGYVTAESMWTGKHPVAPSLLETGKVRPGTVRAAIRELRARDLVRGVSGGIVPGPQFQRLTSAATTILFEELILLAEPNGDLALSIRRLRAAKTPNPEGDH